MSQPRAQISGLSARRVGGAKPYVLAGALGVVAGVISVAFAVLRR